MKTLTIGIVGDVVSWCHLGEKRLGAALGRPSPTARGAAPPPG